MNLLKICQVFLKSCLLSFGEGVGGEALSFQSLVQRTPIKAVRFLIIISIIFFSCNDNKEAKTLFTLMPSDKTGVDFTNTIQENDSLHIMNYEYLYNGHGVGVGDFNNDGLDDIFISGNAVPDKLYLNKKDFQFQDITSIAGVAGNGTWSTGVCVADVNGDGLMDVYVCHSGKFSDSSKLSNELFINQGLNKDSMPRF